MPADRRRVEQHLRAHQARDARRLRIPLVPADQHADRRVARLPHAEAARLACLFAVVVEMAVAGREVVLLVEQRIVRDVHLAVDAEEAPVGVDDRRRVAVDAGRLPLEDRHDDDDRQLTRERLHRVRRRTGNRLGQVEAVALLRLAEVERVEQLLQADDLRAAPGRVPHEPLGAPDDCSAASRIRVVLDDPDREHLLDCPSQNWTGRSVVAASGSGLEKLSSVVVDQLIHTTKSLC